MYPQQDITVKFGRLGSDKIANQIIMQLAPMIKMAGFNLSGQQVYGVPGVTRVNMSYPPELSEIADKVLQAISPAIKGNFTKNISSTHTEGVIFMHIEGEPDFDANGVCSI